MWASLLAQMVKSPLAMQEIWFDPWVGKILWRRAWQLIPVLLLGEFHGQRSLEGYSTWGLKESDTTTLLLLPLGPPGKTCRVHHAKCQAG